MEVIYRLLASSSILIHYNVAENVTSASSSQALHIWDMHVSITASFYFGSFASRQSSQLGFPLTCCEWDGTVVA